MYVYDLKFLYYIIIYIMLISEINSNSEDVFKVHAEVNSAGNRLYSYHSPK